MGFFGGGSPIWGVQSPPTWGSSTTSEPDRNNSALGRGLQEGGPCICSFWSFSWISNVFGVEPVVSSQTCQLPLPHLGWHSVKSALAYCSITSSGPSVWEKQEITIWARYVSKHCQVKLEVHEDAYTVDLSHNSISCFLWLMLPRERTASGCSLHGPGLLIILQRQREEALCVVCGVRVGIQRKGFGRRHFLYIPPHSWCSFWETGMVIIRRHWGISCHLVHRVPMAYWCHRSCFYEACRKTSVNISGACLWPVSGLKFGRNRIVLICIHYVPEHASD